MKNIISLMVPVIIISLVLLWHFFKKNINPIKGNGIKFIYTLIIFLAFSLLCMSQIFISKSGKLVLPNVSFLQVIVAIILGIFISIPMGLTTNFEIREDGKIYSRKNTTFIYVIIGIIIIRFVVGSYLSNIVSPSTLLLLLVILASVYFTIWQVTKFIKFRKMLKSLK